MKTWVLFYFFSFTQKKLLRSMYVCLFFLFVIVNVHVEIMVVDVLVEIMVVDVLLEMMVVAVVQP